MLNNGLVYEVVNGEEIYNIGENTNFRTSEGFSSS